MYWDYYFMGIILLPAIILAIFAEVKVYSTFNEFSKVASKRGLTAKEVARRVLDAKGITDVLITKVNGSLTDYYSDKDKVVALSASNYDSTSVASIGIALHEVGHAIQYDEGYVPIKIRNVMVRVCNISSALLWPLVLIGLLFNFVILIGGVIGNIFLWAGIGFFGFSVILNLVTLPVEYNASNRARELMLTENILTPEEKDMASKVLNAAALTYVAALLTSILNLVRFLLVVLGTRRRD